MKAAEDYKRILVTGACGYIGSALTRQLTKEFPNAHIVLLDKRFVPNSLDRLPPHRFSFVKGDIMDKELVNKVCTDVDLIFHLAAEIGAEDSMANAERVWETNYNGTLNVIKAASKKAKFVFPSTANVFGRDNRPDRSEDDIPYPVFPYANSKRAIESYLQENEARLPEFVICRIATNYGWSEGIRNNLVVNKFAEMIASGADKLTIYGTGETWRPFVHVEDVARALCFVALRPELVGGIVHLGGENHTIKDLAALAAKSAPRKVKLANLEHMESVFSYHLSFNKLKRLGFKCKWNVKTGFEDMLNHYGGLL